MSKRTRSSRPSASEEDPAPAVNSESAEHVQASGTPRLARSRRGQQEEEGAAEEKPGSREESPAKGRSSKRLRISESEDANGANGGNPSSPSRGEHKEERERDTRQAQQGEERKEADGLEESQAVKMEEDASAANGPASESARANGRVTRNSAKDTDGAAAPPPISAPSAHSPAAESTRLASISQPRSNTRRAAVHIKNDGNTIKSAVVDLTTNTSSPKQHPTSAQSMHEEAIAAAGGPRALRQRAAVNYKEKSEGDFTPNAPPAAASRRSQPVVDIAAVGSARLTRNKVKDWVPKNLDARTLKELGLTREQLIEMGAIDPDAEIGPIEHSSRARNHDDDDDEEEEDAGPRPRRRSGRRAIQDDDEREGEEEYRPASRRRTTSSEEEEEEENEESEEDRSSDDDDGRRRRSSRHRSASSGGGAAAAAPVAHGRYPGRERKHFTRFADEQAAAMERRNSRHDYSSSEGEGGGTYREERVQISYERPMQKEEPVTLHTGEVVTMREYRLRLRNGQQVYKLGEEPPGASASGAAGSGAAGAEDENKKWEFDEAGNPVRRSGRQRQQVQHLNIGGGGAEYDSDGGVRGRARPPTFTRGRNRVLGAPPRRYLQSSPHRRNHHRGGATAAAYGDENLSPASSSSSSDSSDEGVERKERRRLRRERNAIQPLHLHIQHAMRKLDADFAPLRGGVPSGLGKRSRLADVDPLDIDTSVDWSSVGGLDAHVAALKEMVVLPLVYPELFERFKLQPPKGVLFSGPPGTGKQDQKNLTGFRIWVSGFSSRYHVFLS
jgi:hypothetical protein